MMIVVEPTREECEQLARSITMSPSLTRDAQLRVVDLLRELAGVLRHRAWSDGVSQGSDQFDRITGVEFGNTQHMGVTTWKDEDRAQHTSRDERARKVIEHLAEHGALEEASDVIDRILDGTEDSPMITHEEAMARLDRFC